MLDRTELIPVARRRAPADRPVRRASSSRSPTRCRTRSRRRTTRPRARSCTPATSRSTSRRSTAAAPTWPASARSPDAVRRRAAAALRLAPTRSGPGSRRRSRRSAHALRTLFRDHEGKRIIVASFASHLHRVQQVAEAAIASGRTRRVRRPVDGQERDAGARDGPARHPRRPRHRHRRGAATTRRARSASSAPARRASR